MIKIIALVSKKKIISFDIGLFILLPSVFSFLRKYADNLNQKAILVGW